MRDFLNGIFDRVCKIIHRIDAPLLARPGVGHVCNPVENRIPHVDVGRRHINSSSQCPLSVRHATCAHLLEHPQVLLHASSPARIFLSRFREGSSVLPDFLGCQCRNICLPVPNQFQRIFKHFFEIIRSMQHLISEIRTQPLYILDDRIHVFAFFLRRIRIVKSKVEFSAIFLRQSVI